MNVGWGGGEGELGGSAGSAGIRIRCTISYAFIVPFFLRQALFRNYDANDVLDPDRWLIPDPGPS
jgi:hypothetical protein